MIFDFFLSGFHRALAKRQLWAASDKKNFFFSNTIRSFDKTSDITGTEIQFLAAEVVGKSAVYQVARVLVNNRTDAENCRISFPHLACMALCRIQLDAIVVCLLHGPVCVLCCACATLLTNYIVIRL